MSLEKEPRRRRYCVLNRTSVSRSAFRRTKIAFDREISLQISPYSPFSPLYEPDFRPARVYRVRWGQAPPTDAFRSSPRHPQSPGRFPSVDTPRNCTPDADLLHPTGSLSTPFRTLHPSRIHALTFALNARCNSWYRLLGLLRSTPAHGTFPTDLVPEGSRRATSRRTYHFGTEFRAASLRPYSPFNDGHDENTRDPCCLLGVRCRFERCLDGSGMPESVAKSGAWVTVVLRRTACIASPGIGSGL